MSAPSPATVKARWIQLAAELELPADLTTTAWAEIKTAYSEPHRHYHTLHHIEAMLSGLDTHRPTFDDLQVAALALIYHDIIYDPARQDNETQSAARLSDRFSTHIDPARVARACRHIEATRRHDPTDDADTNLVLDLDMSILGAPWPDYLAYAAGVYAEYAPIYGAEAYAMGRVKLFLEPTQSKARIFLTSHFAALEAQARDNLAREQSLWLAGKFAV